MFTVVQLYGYCTVMALPESHGPERYLGLSGGGSRTHYGLTRDDSAGLLSIRDIFDVLLVLKSPPLWGTTIGTEPGHDVVAREFHL